MKKPGVHFASAMLLLATAGWGASFTFAKDAGNALNHLSGAGEGAFFGPTALQGIRFLIAAIIFVAVVPATRRGWTRASLARAGYAGGLLGVGIILQHLALDRTTPAATAFLTALTILWVPLINCLVKRELPSPILMCAIAIAAVGLYLLLGDGLRAFRLGEMLGLACSVIFALHLLAVSHVVKLETPWRMTAGQFVVAGIICLVPALYTHPATPAELVRLTLHREVWVGLAVVLAFPTFLAFTLMSFYQPHVDSTRAALIYQAEPVFAAGLDFVVAGRGLTPVEMVGCGLVLAANIAAEALPAMRSEKTAQASPQPGLPEAEECAAPSGMTDE